MTLHLFNPEHDLALASGLANFTAPHAGRQLRHDLGFLPALWAKEGDVVLVDDVEEAERTWQQLAEGCGIKFTDCRFLNWKSWATIGEADAIEPWGWDATLQTALARTPSAIYQLLPTDEDLQVIRQLSHRREAARVLAALRELPATVGEAYECHSMDEVRERIATIGHAVIKAPWSSSGRGVRFTSQHSTPNTQHSTLTSWLQNIIARQGSVMIEPYYNKVKDFGLEFYSDGKGTINYLGLSLFHTENGAYTGNVLATEASKRELLGRVLPLSLLDEAKSRLCIELGALCNGKYTGPLGVDLMVVENKGLTTLLHPCVEINLRRTMGHVALALEKRLNPTDDDKLRHIMQIEYTNGRYHLHIYSE